MTDQKKNKTDEQDLKDVAGGLRANSGPSAMNYTEPSRPRADDGGGMVRDGFGGERIDVGKVRGGAKHNTGPADSVPTSGGRTKTGPERQDIDISNMAGGVGKPSSATPTTGGRTKAAPSSERQDIDISNVAGAGPGMRDKTPLTRDRGGPQSRQDLTLDNVSGGTRGNTGPDAAAWDAPSRSKAKSDSGGLSLDNISGGTLVPEPQQPTRRHTTKSDVLSGPPGAAES